MLGRHIWVVNDEEKQGVVSIGQDSASWRAGGLGLGRGMGWLAVLFLKLDGGYRLTIL